MHRKQKNPTKGFFDILLILKDIAVFLVPWHAF